MKRLTAILMLPGVLLALSHVAFAQEEPAPGEEGVRVNADKINAAVQKGVECLKRLQSADGSWVTNKALESRYPEGTTALVLLALLKSGMDRNDNQIKSGFAFIRSRPYNAVYSVSCLILALEALYTPPPEPEQPAEKKKEEEKKDEKKGQTTLPVPPVVPQEKQIEKNFQRNATPQDRKLLEDAVRWLISKQHTNVWRYPGGSPGGGAPTNPGTGTNSGLEDFSNTQYAMLALNAARRMGYPVPADVWLKVADYAIRNQEAKGPKVDWFPVPAADFDISKLKGMEEKILKELQKAVTDYNTEVKKAQKEGKTPEEAGVQKPGEGPKTTVVIPNPYKEKQYGAEKKDMFARGWAYLPKPEQEVSGSMTTSGVSALVICKVGLEGTAQWSSIKEKVNSAIRDGCAWLAKNFAVGSNPNAGGMWHHYYLYGLERAGVLSLARKLGNHDWYEEGANYLVVAQAADGSWAEDANISAMTNTCFALLFLKKATAPIVQLPGEGQIFTGEGLTGPGKGK
jgi:hypothetical protein